MWVLKLISIFFVFVLWHPSVSVTATAPYLDPSLQTMETDSSSEANQESILNFDRLIVLSHFLEKDHLRHLHENEIHEATEYRERLWRIREFAKTPPNLKILKEKIFELLDTTEFWPGKFLPDLAYSLWPVKGYSDAQAILIALLSREAVLSVEKMTILNRMSPNESEKLSPSFETSERIFALIENKKSLEMEILFASLVKIMKKNQVPLGQAQGDFSRAVQKDYERKQATRFFHSCRLWLTLI